MKNSKTFRFTSVITVVLVTLTLLISPAFKSDAGSLDAAYLFLSRIETDVDGSTETVEYVLAFAPNQTIPSGGTVTLEFPDADDANWCRTADTLTVTGVASSVVDLSTTDWAIDAVLPTSSSLAATCTQGSGSSSSDKITISNVGELTGGTTYGVKVTNGTAAGVIGTDDTAGGHDVTVEAKQGATIDSSTFKINLISNDTVVISATVSDIPSVTCSISTNTVDLGSLYPGGSYATGSHTISTNTSTTASGYYWAAYGQGDGSTDAGLWKSSATTKLLASTGSTTIDLTGVNAEGFGMTVSDPDTTGSAVVPADFSDASTGTFGSLDRAAAGAQLILYQNGAQSSGESSTITYGARASSTAPAGSYSESVTFVCGAYY